LQERSRKGGAGRKRGEKNTKTKKESENSVVGPQIIHDLSK